MGYSELLQVSGRLTTEYPWLTTAKYFDKVDSTQKRVGQWLPKTGEGAILVLAEVQSQAVGRQERPWASPAGGVWFTLALPLNNVTLANVASFSMVASLVVAKSLEEINNLKCNLKWPNDILYEGKKVAGVLLTTTAKFKKPWVLIGVGVNVNNELPAELSKIATSIKAVRGQSQGRTRLIESVLGGLWNAWQEFDRTGFGPYQKAFEERLVGIGGPVKIMTGDKNVQGTMVGIDAQGGLILKSGANTKTITAGEIVG